MTPGGKGPVCGVDVDDISPCSTGPPGRLIWSGRSWPACCACAGGRPLHVDLVAFTAAGFWSGIGRSLRESFYMFWATLWALVLGFALSGAVQAFVSRQAMQRHLGDHRPAAVTRASLYGMASSSCSYAATAMARSIFVRGADFLAAMVFMFASTNLVIELGIVLLVLIGWQFLAAEFIGGAIMILLLVTAGGLWLRGRAVIEARTRAPNRPRAAISTAARRAPRSGRIGAGASAPGPAGRTPPATP